jgi:formate dehydrogenase maturation protein FdhE
MKNYPELREQVLRGIQALRGVSYLPEEYLNFRVGLFLAQLAAYNALQPATTMPHLPLQPGSIYPDPELIERLLIETSASLGENLSARTELEKLAKNRESLAEIVEAAVFGPDLKALQRLSSKTGAKPDALLFFGRAAGAPYISRLVWSASEDVLDNSSETGACPYCGSFPGLSLLRGESGRRFLVCPLCGMEREFPRMRCPFCGAEASLSIIREGETAPRWIETCESCGNYLKTSDLRKLATSEEFIPLVESAAAFYLDFIAEKQGCKRGVPYLAMK